jgi:hypothetical protein
MRPNHLSQMHEALVCAWRRWREMGAALERAQRAYDALRREAEDADAEEETSRTPHER